MSAPYEQPRRSPGYYPARGPAVGQEPRGRLSRTTGNNEPGHARSPPSGPARRAPHPVRRQARGVDWPVSVALAQAVPTLPEGKGLHYEPKLDGHRLVLWRDAETVRLQTRSGRDVTAVWMDLAVAGLQLPAGTVLDGEGIVYVDGRVDFGAAQSRANSTPARARELAARWPGHLALFDILQHPDVGDTRALPYVERRGSWRSCSRTTGIGPPLQAVPTITDVATARLWYDSLKNIGIEGLVVMAGSSVYRGGFEAVAEDPAWGDGGRRGGRLYRAGRAATAPGRAAHGRPSGALADVDVSPVRAGGAVPRGVGSRPAGADPGRGRVQRGRGRCPGGGARRYDATCCGDRDPGEVAPHPGLVRSWPTDGSSVCHGRAPPAANSWGPIGWLFAGLLGVQTQGPAVPYRSTPA
ncbi:ATP-dependent DNA ligase [Streptomyces sp. PT19]|uniref:ATP-dependent DNA ligase n=1 Tax=Streptomyces sp. PT19 TaxID=3452239 RepID=UPI003F802E3F